MVAGDNSAFRFALASPLNRVPTGFAPIQRAVIRNCLQEPNSQRPMNPGAALDEINSAFFVVGAALRNRGAGLPRGQKA